jgi:hypothetical protein
VSVAVVLEWVICNCPREVSRTAFSFVILVGCLGGVVFRCSSFVAI